MTDIEDKREEIREGFARTLGKYSGQADQVYQLLKYLHSQGCVLKVDRELPKLGDYDKRRTTSESVDFQDGFLVAKIAMRKAGYEATVPLI